ncbi:MAG: DNA recombination protein RmuC [Acidobacteria bacterium]|nr:DNA recombination protein RmuC [Acidobacteriota bacterium]
MSLFVLVLILLLQAILVFRTFVSPRGAREQDSSAWAAALAEQQRRIEQTLEEQLRKERDEANRRARELREEVATQIGALRESSEKKQEQVRAALTGSVVQLQQSNEVKLAEIRKTADEKLDAIREAGDAAGRRLRTDLHERLEDFRKALEALREGNEKKLQEVNAVLGEGVAKLQESNAAKLEEMRKTVDEKLHGALEKRLGESFKQVSERLEAVHAGLGEMQSLANGVGDLKRLMGNVKSRGTWGEMQLGGLLESFLAPEQFGSNVEIAPGSGERVEFAIRLPGQGERTEPVWLPIDAKFPQEDYQRLLDAEERADPAGIDAARKGLDRAVRLCAKEIGGKYIHPPRTTDFAILFVPVESLYAEILRAPGLAAALQQEAKIILAGPTTLAALLNSLQMGFRTLAIQQRTSEVWEVLGAVKTEFGKFGQVLHKVRKKLDEASNVMDAADRRSRAMERKLRDVEALPEPEAAGLLQLEEPPGEASAASV